MTAKVLRAGFKASDGAKRSMNDRHDPAMTADDAAGPVSAGPPLGAFLGAEETRLRDLIAFGMAAEAGRIGPDGIEGLRRKAEAELHAHAFRLLHNEAERIRREGMDAERARAPRAGGFARLVAANLVALALFAAGLLAALAADPALLPRLAQLAAKG